MARVLIGWELGAARGHISAINPVVQNLLARGHTVHLALQQIDAAGIDADKRIELWQAPAWPRLFMTRSRGFSAHAATMGDILGRLGLDTPGTLAALIAGWESILSAVKPQLVVAEFAPALLCAARGRLATARMGTGFATPPAHLDRYPLLAGSSTQFPEDELLDIADADLRSLRRPALSALPALGGADHDLVRSFSEFDAYAADRLSGYVRPNAPADLLSKNVGGDEIFCYFPDQMSADLPIWQGLAGSGKPVRIHMRETTPEHHAVFQRMGFRFEPRPVPFATIASRSRLTVSHGGHGFVTASMLSGLPQVITGYDLEKFAIGKAVVANGLGAYANLFTLKAEELGEAISTMHADDARAAYCRDLAQNLAMRPLPTIEQRLDEIVDAL